MNNYPLILWSLTILFFLRVIGQFLVAFFNVTFLPPMPNWYSGLLPYPILLPTQILIILLQLKINNDFSRNKGFFIKPRRKLGMFLQWFSYAYAGIMAIRYVITMYLYPERRWFGEGTIPIIFHFVLAGYLFTLAKYYINTTKRIEDV
jgi:hypothetical protein